MKTAKIDDLIKTKLLNFFVKATLIINNNYQFSLLPGKSKKESQFCVPRRNYSSKLKIFYNHF